MITWALYHKVASPFVVINGRRISGMSRSFICVVGLMVRCLLIVVLGPPESARAFDFIGDVQVSRFLMVSSLLFQFSCVIYKSLRPGKRHWVYTRGNAVDIDELFPFIFRLRVPITIKGLPREHFVDVEKKFRVQAAKFVK